MSVVHHLWKGRRVRVAGALDQVAVASPDEMAAIYELYWDLVYRRCYATLQDEEAALDTTQDVFLNALKSFEDIRHDIVRGLMDLARTLAYERRRRPAREVTLAHPRSAERADDPAEIAERHDVLDAVWAGLSPVERRYLADKFAGFSFEEIARRNRRALGTVSSNLARAREHARRMREPMLPAVLGVAGWRRLTDLSRRLRSAAQSSSVSAAAQPVQTLTLSLTVAGLLAGTAPGLTSPAVPASIGMPALTALSAEAGSSPAATTVSSSASDRPATAVAPPSGATSTKPAAAGPSAGLQLPLVSADQETPEDTQIVDATPSPNYSEDNTIVALGHGRTCACNLIMESTDGGATWTSRQGPADGQQVVLPPDYPRDPRIFVGYASASSTATDYWTPAFGEKFRTLPLPAGPLALPAGFDRGDQRVIVSAMYGVWSYDMGTFAVQPLIVDRSTSSAAGIAAPAGAISRGVFAVTSAAAEATGSAPDTVGTAQGLKLWACPPGSACSATGSVPLSTSAHLVASPDFESDATLLAYTSARMVLSQDGGSTFTSLALPPGATYVDAVTLGYPVNGVLSVWSVVRRGHTTALEMAGSATGPWTQVAVPVPQVAGDGRLTPLAASRLIFLSPTTGFMCTADNGLSWHTRCPSA